METAVMTAAISGVFSLVSAFGSVWLKDYLEHRSQSARPTVAVKPVEVRKGTRRWSAWRPILVLAGGFIAGIVSRSAREMISGPLHYEALLSIIVLGGVCLLLALNHRGRRGFWPYQLEALALWAAYTSGWSLVNAGVWSDLVQTTFLLWIVCAIVGGVIVVIPRRNPRAA